MSPSDNEKTEIGLFPEAETYPCLEVLSGPKGKGRYPLKEGKNTIGRLRENDIVFDDSSVSRHHAEIEISAGQATIRDTGSRNGTKVAGQKIAQGIVIPHDTRIKIGAFQLRYLTQPAGEAVAEEAAETPDEAPPPSEEVDLLQTTGEHLSDLPPSEEVSPYHRSGKRSLILYGSLILVFVVVVVFGGPQVFKFFKGGKKSKKDSGTTETTTSTSATGQAGTVGGVLPAKTTSPAPKPEGPQPVFLEFSSTPISAQVFFGEDKIGLTPMRTSTNLTAGKWYEARALFQLPEVGEVVEERTQFTLPLGASIVPVNFSGKIGVFKITALPRDAQLYLEGYFEKDPYRAKPIKFSEIVFGKPVYVPFGRYILELRRSRQLGQSQTFLDEVVYRREFYINKDQPSFTVDVSEEALKNFPVQITSIPPGAKVLIDNQEVGATPYSGTFPVGEHQMVMKREGYFDYVQRIKMEINQPYTAEIQLKTSEAGDLINRADAMMKEERFTEALPILAEAFSKNPSPRETAQISYLVGICYLRQKALKEAQDYFLKATQHEDYKYAGRLGLASVTLEQGDSVRALQTLVEVLMSSEDSKVRADAGALFQKISPLKSVLYITSDPQGAKVWVNGTEVAQTTPMILHDLGVGAYTIQIKKPGYALTEIKLNLGVSEFRPVEAKLKIE